MCSVLPPDYIPIAVKCIILYQIIGHTVEDLQFRVITPNELCEPWGILLHLIGKNRSQTALISTPKELVLKILQTVGFSRLAINFFRENENVLCNGAGAARYRNTGLKNLCILNCFIQTPMTYLWNWKIITTHTQFDVYEYVDVKSWHRIIIIK